MPLHSTIIAIIDGQTMSYRFHRPEATDKTWALLWISAKVTTVSISFLCETSLTTILGRDLSENPCAVLLDGDLTWLKLAGAAEGRVERLVHKPPNIFTIVGLAIGSKNTSLLTVEHPILCFFEHQLAGFNPLKIVIGDY